MVGWRDESGLIVGWLVRLVLSFVVAGVLLFDAGSMLINYFTLASTADDIAVSTSTDLVGEDAFFNQEPYRRQARALARDSGARLVDFQIDREGRVELTLRRTASTLVLDKVPTVRDWARATAEASISPTQ